MQWHEIRRSYPRQWLLVEALAAQSQAGKRIVEDLAVVGTYADGTAAMTGYKDLHRREPGRELYVVHTEREDLDIGELHWFGILQVAGGTGARRRFDVPSSSPLWAQAHSLGL